MSEATEPLLPESVVLWLTHLERNRRYSVHTLDAYRRDLQQLVRLHEDKSLEQVVNGNIRH